MCKRNTSQQVEKSYVICRFILKLFQLKSTIIAAVTSSFKPNSVWLVWSTETPRWDCWDTLWSILGSLF